MKEVDVVIIGAGTAGLTARRQIEKVTKNYIVADDGPMGTTCARVGCMPSKVLIQVANDFDRRHKMAQMGILNGKDLKIDSVEVMKHVRSLRDRFTRSVYQGMESWKDHLIRSRATILSENSVQIGNEIYKTKHIIIATGSRPIIPESWMKYRDYLITTDEFFEMPRLPDSVAVFGLGVIGSELGQALHRLGVNLVAITTNRRVGGVSDPVIQDYVIKKFQNEFPIHFNGGEIVGTTQDNKIEIKADGKSYIVDKILMSMGRTPNVDKIGLQNISYNKTSKGLPKVDRHTLKIDGTTNIYLSGDVNGEIPILHEAADDGKIAGLHIVNSNLKFKRRTPLAITFTDPNIATAGMSYAEILQKNLDFEFGEVTFEGQGRSIVKLKEQGLMRIYATKSNGKLLGSELQAPEGEHIAHLLSWCIQQDLTVFDVLKMPFYHPVVEEGLRTALRDLAFKVSKHNKIDFEELTSF